MSLLPFLRHSSSYGREGSGLGNGYGNAKRLARTNLLNSGGRIVPRVETWPFSVDQNGQSFPGGLVGVRFDYSPTPGSDPVTFNKQYLLAVPGTLPVGYTLRASRDCNRGAFPSSDSTKGLAFPFRLFSGTVVPNVFGWSAAAGATPTRIRIGNALTDYTWMPETVADTCITSAVFSTGYLWTGAPIAGFRYWRFNSAITGATSGFRLWARERISVNADGSVGNSHTMGDTVLYERVASADFPAQLPVWDTGYMDGSPYYPTLGTRRYYCFSRDVVFQNPPSTQPSDWSGGIDQPPPLYLGSRCDIPLPYTFTGLDDSGGHLVAPGGVVPGSLPGF